MGGTHTIVTNHIWVSIEPAQRAGFNSANNNIQNIMGHVDQQPTVNSLDSF